MERPLRHKRPVSLPLSFLLARDVERISVLVQASVQRGLLRACKGVCKQVVRERERERKGLFLRPFISPPRKEREREKRKLDPAIASEIFFLGYVSVVRANPIGVHFLAAAAFDDREGDSLGISAIK